jgi:hypothetical protein
MRHLLAFAVLLVTDASANSKAKKIVPQLVGKTATSFGPALKSINIDDFSINDPAFQKLEALGFEIQLASRSGALVIIPPDQATCEALHALMTARWGRPVDDGGDYWLDPKTGTRTWFVSCEWRTDKYITIEQLVNRTEASVLPIHLIGKPATSVESLRPAIGTTLDRVHIYVENAGGKVVGVSAVLSDKTVVPALLVQLTKLFGKPEQSTESKRRWAGPPVVTLDTRPGYVTTLIVGAPPKH